MEVMPEKVSDAVLDGNIDIHLNRKQFTADAWLLVKNVIDRKKANNVYACGSCYHDVSESPSLICEHCLQWYHMKCVYSAFQAAQMQVASPATE